LIERRGDKGMPVAVRPANGDETFARPKATGIDGEACHGGVSRAEAAPSRGADDLA
jgi:hypothetical protein